MALHTWSVIIGAATSMFGVGAPTAAYLLHLDKTAGKALRLLVGEESVDGVEGRGLIARVRLTEQRLERVTQALRESDAVTLPDEASADE